MSYALAEAYPGPPLFMTLVDRAVSTEAVELRECLAISLPAQSSAVTGRHRDVTDRVTAALVEGFSQGIFPLPRAINQALAVMCSLPDDVRLPNVIVEDDGEIGLDWDSGQRSVLSVIAGDSSMLRYAALIGPEPLHGRVPFAGVLPATLSYILRRISPD